MGGKTEKNRPWQMTYYCFNRSVPSWSVNFFVCVWLMLEMGNCFTFSLSVRLVLSEHANVCDANM